MVAMAYGGRWDIAQACRSLAADAAAGVLAAADIGETHVAERLALAGIPDPDLLIRTGGERRISNFLLWNLAYTELYFSDDALAGVLDGASGRRIRVLCAARAPLRQDFGAAHGESRCLRTPMLRTRVLTAAVLGCLLLAGLFLLPPPWTVLAFGAVFTVGAWEWAAFGALRSARARARLRGRRRAAAGAAWRWTADRRI